MSKSVQLSYRQRAKHGDTRHVNKMGGGPEITFTLPLVERYIRETD